MSGNVDLSDTILILADKLGMSIEYVYKLNLQVQTFKAIEMLICVLVWIVISSIAVYTFYKNRGPYDEIEAVILVSILILTVLFIPAICLSFVLDSVCMRLLFPEYTAMSDTIDMLRGLV